MITVVVGKESEEYAGRGGLLFSLKKEWYERINGWIHDKSEAAEEFGISEAEVSKCWNNNLKIGISEGRNLLGLPEIIGA